MMKKYKMVLDASENPDIGIHVEVIYKGQKITKYISSAVFDFIMLQDVPENELILDGIKAGIVTPIYDEDTVGDLE